MTPEQTIAALDSLNMTRRAAARALNVGERTIRRWQKIGAPDWLPNAIRGLKSEGKQ